MSIASAFKKCWNAFLRISKLLGNTKDEQLIKINNEKAQLRMWSQHYGAHQINKSSLDEKLRDAPQLRDVVIDCLERIEDCVSRILTLKVCIHFLKVHVSVLLLILCTDCFDAR